MVVTVWVTVVGTVVVTVCVRLTVTVWVGPVTVRTDVDPGLFTVFRLVTVTRCLTVLVSGFAETATIRVVPFLVTVCRVAADELGSEPMATPSAAPRIMSNEPPAIVANAFDPRISRNVSMPGMESTLPGAWHG